MNRRICILIISALALTLLPNVIPAHAATAGAVYELRIDSDHRATTDAIFKPGERVAFWFNLSNGAARDFVHRDTGYVYAWENGTLNVVFSAADWANIPLSATSIVAWGTDSGVAAVYLMPIPPDLDLSLTIDANHRATTAPIFTVNERVVFWYNLPDGSAKGFYSTDEYPYVYARANGTLDYTIPGDYWATIPSDATSFVAAGFYSGVTAVYIFQR